MDERTTPTAQTHTDAAATAEAPVPILLSRPVLALAKKTLQFPNEEGETANKTWEDIQMMD